MNLYHVTSKKNLRSIQKKGLRSGIGDWGDGIYFFDNIYDARDLADEGGWDESIKDPIILKVETNEAAQEPVDPSWPDPEKYESVWYIPKRYGAFWVPETGAIEVLE
jgi:hypothetical protein